VKLRLDVAGLVLAGLVAVCLTVCAVVGADAPSFLAELGLVALGAGAGVAIPRGAAPVEPSLPPAAAVRDGYLEGDAPRAPAPLPREPETGIFSRVTP
jgi:hypothetical protein